MLKHHEPSTMNYKTHRTMKHIILALFLHTVCTPLLQAQAGEAYKTFDFIYVDNSRPTPTDGLSQKQIELIEQRATKIAEDNGRLILYASNGESPRTTTEPEDVSKLLNNLLENDTPLPSNKFAEKKLIREVLYDDVFEVNGQVSFHFFVTNRYASSLEKKAGAMIAMLSNEFAQTLGFEENITVNLYINNNQDDKLKLNKIKETLQYAANQVKMKITYNIIPV